MAYLRFRFSSGRPWEQVPNAAKGLTNPFDSNARYTILTDFLFDPEDGTEPITGGGVGFSFGQHYMFRSLENVSDSTNNSSGAVDIRLPYAASTIADPVYVVTSPASYAYNVKSTGPTGNYVLVRTLTQSSMSSSGFDDVIGSLAFSYNETNGTGSVTFTPYALYGDSVTFDTYNLLTNYTTRETQGTVTYRYYSGFFMAGNLATSTPEKLTQADINDVFADPPIAPSFSPTVSLGKFKPDVHQSFSSYNGTSNGEDSFTLKCLAKGLIKTNGEWKQAKPVVYWNNSTSGVEMDALGDREFGVDITSAQLTTNAQKCGHRCRLVVSTTEDGSAEESAVFIDLVANGTSPGISFYNGAFDGKYHVPFTPPSYVFYHNGTSMMPGSLAFDSPEILFSLSTTSWATERGVYDVGTYTKTWIYTSTIGSPGAAGGITACCYCTGTAVVTQAFVRVQLSIDAQEPTISSKTYDGTNSSGAETDTQIDLVGKVNGVATGDDVVVTVTITGNFSQSDAGACTLPVSYSISGADASKYFAPIPGNATATINPRPVTISNVVSSLN